MVRRRRLRDLTTGLATLNAPVPPLPVSMRTTSKFWFVGPVFVLVVALASGSGEVGSRLDASSPDWADTTIDALVGICACQSNSLHCTAVPEGHDPVKSSVNVAALYPGADGGGGGGGALSGDTHEVRSKNMNSSAFS